jgi:hypothetical protein
LELVFARFVRTLELALFSLRPEQELGEEHYDSRKREKQGQEKGWGNFGAAEPVSQSQGNEDDR